MVDLVLERALHESIAGCGGKPPPLLGEAIGYAVFPGGARVRPRLCLEVARACGYPGRRTTDLSYAAACSVELLHCASLVHDDLPCFDASPTRRGRPTVHRIYGEAMAVLVGDGLMVQSFHTLARALAHRPDIGALPLVTLLDAAGPHRGLIAGQAWELEKEVDVAAYHHAKTASLFEASALLGAMVSGEGGARFAAFGRAFGMAYQLADDVADVVGDPAKLGKPVGRDQALGRPTAVPDVASVDDALARLDEGAEKAITAVPSCPGESDLRRFVEAVFGAISARFEHDRRRDMRGKSRLSA